MLASWSCPDLARRGRIRRWGGSAVEFAMVAPFLGVLVLGMIECARALMV